MSHQPPQDEYQRQPRQSRQSRRRYGRGAHQVPPDRRHSPKFRQKHPEEAQTEQFLSGTNSRLIPPHGAPRHIALHQVRTSPRR